MTPPAVSVHTAAMVPPTLQQYVAAASVQPMLHRDGSNGQEPQRSQSAVTVGSTVAAGSVASIRTAPMPQQRPVVQRPVAQAQQPQYQQSQQQPSVNRSMSDSSFTPMGTVANQTTGMDDSFQTATAFQPSRQLSRTPPRVQQMDE